MADLGGLGAKEGTPVVHSWSFPNLVPILLPWLAVLGLLALRPNRCAQAWWIWVPLGAFAMLSYGLQAVFGSLPSEVQEPFDQIFQALAFGLAAMWLLASYLGRKSRFLSFLGSVAVLAGFSLVAFIVRQDLSESGDESLVMMVVLGLGAVALSLAVHLAGWACRRTYRPLRFSLWVVIWLALGWTLTAALFFVPISLSQGRIQWQEFFPPVAIITSLSFATLLPFLILTFASSFYQTRLNQLLNLPGETPVPPPVISTPEPSLGPL